MVSSSYTQKQLFLYCHLFPIRILATETTTYHQTFWSFPIGQNGLMNSGRQTESTEMPPLYLYLRNLLRFCWLSRRNAKQSRPTNSENRGNHLTIKKQDDKDRDRDNFHLMLSEKEFLTLIIDGYYGCSSLSFL